MSDDGRVVAISIPHKVAETAGDLARSLIQRLGESPEAWRGAALALSMVKVGIKAHLIDLIMQRDTGEMRGELEVDDFYLIMSTVHDMLESTPMWPEDLG